MLSFLTLSISSCSDLFGKKVTGKKIESNRLKANCELDMTEFASILDRPITGALDCLEKNLNIFMDVSELSKGEKLSKEALVSYLKRNQPNIDPRTFIVLESIFALSRLISGEEPDFISRKNVELTLNLVRNFNLSAHRHYNNTFGSSAPANLAVHNSHRVRVEAAAQEIQEALSKIYVPDRKGEIHVVQVMDILKGFVKDEDGALAKIEGILFVKKIILGGDSKTINHLELGYLFSELPRVLRLALDVTRYKHLKLEQRELMSFLREDTIALEKLLFHPSRGDRQFEGLFDVDVAIDGLDRFIKDDTKKISKYRVLVKEAIRIFTDTRQSESGPQWMTGKNLEKLISHAYTVTNRSLKFHQFYNSPNIKPLLDSPASVMLDPKHFDGEFPQDRVEFAEFARIVNSYRYMKGSSEMATYSVDHHRNAAGVAEISMFEYMIKTFFGYYGSSLSMSDKQLISILKKFENELIEMEIMLPRRTRNTAETIALLGSLFQSQSDDNKVLDVDEATEFAVSLVSAIDAKKKLFAFYEDKNCERDEFDRMDPKCFKENFIASICTSYRSKFPRLFEYLGANPKLGCEQNFNSAHNMAYLNASAQAARTCHVYPDDNSEIMYSQGDIMSMLLAMMHIETTISRWDKNLNNTMDSDEVVDAYAIYKPAINGMLPKLPAVLDTPKIRETLAKQVYLYLVKFEEVPKTKSGQDIWQLVKFLLSFDSKKAPAHRKTIASILRIVSEEGKKKALLEYEANPNDPNVGKPFDCNWLRDPSNIPRD